MSHLDGLITITITNSKKTTPSPAAKPGRKDYHEERRILPA